MSNNLPIKFEKQSLVKRIISFLKSFFTKKEKVQEMNKVEPILKQDEAFKNQYIIKENNIKLVKPLSEIERIIQIIEKEPKTLKKLSVEKLEIIDNYYIEQIAEYKRKVSNM